MAVYTEKNVKSQAVDIFVNLIKSQNATLGNKLEQNRESIYWKALTHIQQIGIHAYADLVLARNSAHREALLEAIEAEEAV